MSMIERAIPSESFFPPDLETGSIIRTRAAAVPAGFEQAHHFAGEDSLPLPVLPPSLLESFAREALEEDVGGLDLTSEALIPPQVRARAAIVAREAGIVSGLPLAEAVFSIQDPEVVFRSAFRDGVRVDAGTVVASVSGGALSLLAAERVVLNFLQRLSGIATMTNRYVESVEGTGARILDTRKTTPGLRILEKYAVRCGGGWNHRLGLHHGVMIKDNHRAILKKSGVALADALGRARTELPGGTMVEIEADTAEEVGEALSVGADIILLDNMEAEEMAAAVAKIGGRALTEASGGITLEGVRRVAETGVDFISVGALTHSARSLDWALDIEIESRKR